MGFLNKKRKKILLISLSSIIGVLVIAVVFLFIFLEDIVSSRLKGLLEEKFGTYYHMEFESLEKDVSLSTVSIKINNVSFTTDTTNLAGIERYPIIFFKTKRLKIHNISTWDILLGTKLRIEEISIDNPDFIFFERNLKMQKSVNGEEFSTDVLTEFDLGKFALNKGHFEMWDFEENKRTLYNNELDLEVIGLNLKINELKNYKEAVQFEDINIKAYMAEYAPLVGIYSFKVDSLIFDYSDERIHMSAIDIITKNSLKEESMNTKNQQEVINLKILDVNVSGIDFKKLYLEDKLHIKKAAAKDIFVDVFKNKLKAYESDFSKEVLNTYFREIPFPMTIDSITFKNANVSFDIWNSYLVQPANMKIEHMSGVIERFSTDKEVGDTMKLAINAVLMNSGTVSMSAEIAIFDSVNNYQKFWGTVRDFPFTKMTPLVGNFVNVKITSGHLHQLDFVGYTNNWNSWGSVAFRYSDMKFDIYSLKDLGDKKKDGFLTGMASTVVYPNNPLKNGDFRLATFKYTRKKQEGSIMLWVGGIVVGAIKTCLKDFVIEIIKSEKKKDISKVIKERAKHKKLNEQEARKNKRQEKKKK